jgi:hypothetical protein
VEDEVKVSSATQDQVLAPSAHRPEPLPDERGKPRVDGLQHLRPACLYSGDLSPQYARLEDLSHHFQIR